MYLPTPIHAHQTGFGGWYVTVNVAHATLCKDLDCDKFGWYTVYVEPWRSLQGSFFDPKELQKGVLWESELSCLLRDVENVGIGPKKRLKTIRVHTNGLEEKKMRDNPFKTGGPEVRYEIATARCCRDWPVVTATWTWDAENDRWKKELWWMRVCGICREVPVIWNDEREVI